MSFAATLRALVSDLRAEGIPYEPEIDRLPFLVRERAALTTALGHVVTGDDDDRRPAGLTWRERLDRRLRLDGLRRRLLTALDDLEAIGLRSVYASWFRRLF